jgi:excisionase family DNA binding protein
MLSIDSLESINRLLNAAEIAELLFVSVKTVYQWTELDHIPYVKLNGSVRFHPKDISVWLAQCKKGPKLHYNDGAQIVAAVPRKGGL